MILSIRKSYSVKYKKAVVDYVNRLGRASDAARLFHINPSMISRWKKQYHTMLDHSDKKRYRLGTPGRHVAHPKKENLLYHWITEERQQGYVVNLVDVRHKMLALISNSYPDQHQSQFRASTGWLYGFLHRFELCLRIPTKHIKSCQRVLEAETDIAECDKISSFRSFINNIQSTNNIEQIINVDQTPVWLNSGSTIRTVCLKGTKCVKTIIPDGNPREKYTVILACDSVGRKLPPAIIAKSTRKKARISLCGETGPLRTPQ